MMAKYVRFAAKGNVKFGLVEGEQVLGLAGNPVVGAAVPDGSRYVLAQVSLLAPVEPGKILAVGRNYKEHAAEFGNEVPKAPMIFSKPPTALNGPGGEVVYPPETQNLHFEGELVAVIGKAGRHIPQSEALSHVFGYTCGNDITARDLQRADGQWLRGKGFDTFCPLGPWIVTGLDASSLDIRTLLGGELKQHSNTSKFIFPLDFIISYISNFCTLLPGDVIMTGTPEGVGPMQPGDVVTVDIEGIGQLSNTIVRR